MTAYIDPLTGELRCAVCNGPGKTVYVGSIRTAGHTVVRRGGDKHGFVIAKPSSRASQQVSPPRTAGSPLSTARLARTVE